MPLLGLPNSGNSSVASSSWRVLGRFDLGELFFGHSGVALAQHGDHLQKLICCHGYPLNLNGIQIGRVQGGLKGGTQDWHNRKQEAPISITISTFGAAPPSEGSGLPSARVRFRAFPPDSSGYYPIVINSLFAKM